MSRFKKIQSHSGLIHFSLGYGASIQNHAKRLTTICEMGLRPSPEPDGPVNCPFCLQIMRALAGQPYDPAFKWQPDAIILKRCNTVQGHASAGGGDESRG